MTGPYPLPESNLSALGFAAKPLDHLGALIQTHIAEGRYAGAQIALARNGKLGLFRTYGNARTENTTVPATNETLFLLFSQTKVLTSSAVWTLVEEGKLSSGFTFKNPNQTGECGCGESVQLKPADLKQLAEARAGA